MLIPYLNRLPLLGTQKFLAGFVAVVAFAFAETPNSEQLRADLKHEPFAPSVLAPYLKSRDPKIISVVKEEFLETVDPTEDGQRSFADVQRAIEARAKKRELAFALCKMKADDGTAFNYLLRLASQGITSDAPMIYLLDGDGNLVRGKTSHLFDEWSASHGMNVKEATTFEIAVYVDDLVILRGLRDPRSKGTFERGLRSNNLAVVSVCIFGLAALDDLDAIPLIHSAAQKTMGFAVGRDTFAVALASFKGDEAVSTIRKEFSGTPILPAYEKCIQKRSNEPPVTDIKK